ncbi:MAG: hypothetical protein PHQ52_06600 [Candidatus Omnitrophica bacterium]|nr:hypothetical protein [Candidatus Omnitrophota bacterium]
MEKLYSIAKKTITVCMVFCLYSSVAFCSNHIQEMTMLRDSIIAQSNQMPPLIRAASADDIRTLERIYELNTSTLTTIEAYFKMIKVITSSQVEINNSIIQSLNEWLQFINNQCEFDTDYLNEALQISKTPSTIEQIQAAKAHMVNLVKITNQGIDENLLIIE